MRGYFITKQREYDEQEAGFLIISIRLDDAMSSSRCRNSSIKLNSTWGTIPRQIAQQCAGKLSFGPIWLWFGHKVRSKWVGPGYLRRVLQHLLANPHFYNCKIPRQIDEIGAFVFPCASIWSQNQTSDNRLHLLANIPPRSSACFIAYKPCACISFIASYFIAWNQLISSSMWGTGQGVNKWLDNYDRS